MKKKEQTIDYYQYRATMPVVEQVPVTILASSYEDAKQQATDCGFTLVGQLDAAGNIMKEPRP